MRKLSSTHQKPSRTIICYITRQLNLKNIDLEPNHDRWCGYLHRQLCKQIYMFVEGVKEVRAKFESCLMSSTYQKPSRLSFVAAGSSESQKCPQVSKPRSLVWMFAQTTLQTNLRRCSWNVWRRCVASVGAVCGRQRNKSHLGLSFVAPGSSESQKCPSRTKS